MKKILYLMVCCSAFLGGCKQELPFYSEDTTPYLNFVYDKNNWGEITDSVVNYTFVYSDKAVERDTIWLEVQHVGNIPTTDLHFTLKQVNETEGAQAEPGVHYVAFDDPEVVSRCVMPAGKITAKVPLILLRDASLKKKDVRLRVAITDDNDYLAGVNGQSQRLYVLSDRLAQPSTWNDYITYMVYGPYTKKKHEFLIWANQGERIDEEYFLDVLNANSASFWKYLNNRIKIKLAEYNADPNHEDAPLFDEETGDLLNFDTML